MLRQYTDTVLRKAVSSTAQKLFVATALSCFMTTVFAEPTAEDINGFFNPRPDAHTDLDAIFDLGIQSGMDSGDTVLDLFLDYDYIVQDIDTQQQYNGGLGIVATKSPDFTFDIEASYLQQRYVTSSDSPVDGLGEIFSFVDSGTADPRSFWFGEAELGRQQAEGFNATTLGLGVGFGRGRIYSTQEFRRAWIVTQKLSASGRLNGQPTTAQLYELGVILDNFFIPRRAAADESHGLERLNSIRFGEYRREFFQDIWDYLLAQGLVSGAADLNAVFDMRDAIDFRSLSEQWGGGAQVRVGLVLDYQSEIEDDTDIGLEIRYDQIWPIDIRAQYEASAFTQIDTDADISIGANAGYLKELNDYLLWDTDLTAVVNILDDFSDTTAIALISSLEYELSDSSSLIGVFNTNIDEDFDADYELTARLVFDLL